MRAIWIGALVCTLAACGDDRGRQAVDAAEVDAPATIRACRDIDATGLTSATIDELVARYTGRPCIAPLEGGISSLQQECQYGALLTVCGQSSGLSQFGCRCSFGGQLTCSNGETIKADQERLCGDAGVR